MSRNHSKLTFTRLPLVFQWNTKATNEVHAYRGHIYVLYISAMMIGPSVCQSTRLKCEEIPQIWPLEGCHWSHSRRVICPSECNY